MSEKNEVSEKISNLDITDYDYDQIFNFINERNVDSKIGSGSNKEIKEKIIESLRNIRIRE